MLYQNMTVFVQAMQPQNMQLCYIILSWRHLETGNVERGYLFYLKTDFRKGIQWSCLLPKSLSTRHIGLSMERRLKVYTTPRKLSDTIISPIRRAYSSFLKVITLTRGLCPPLHSLLRRYLNLNSKPPWGVIHFWVPPMYI